MNSILLSTVRGAYFRASYLFGFAPWDIREPQPALVDRMKRSRIPGRSVLDIGCGPGDNAIFMAQQGYEVLGIDYTGGAIRKAREKAREAGVQVRFEQRNFWDLAQEQRQWDIVVDSGLFHTLKGEEASRYVGIVSRVCAPGGTLVLIAFSEYWKGEMAAMARRFGPRPILRDEITRLFQEGWTIEDMSLIDYPTTQGPNPGVAAFLTRAK